MSTIETAKVIEAQIQLMELELYVVVQKLKVKELRVRAEVLLARATLEEHKIEGITNGKVEK